MTEYQNLTCFWGSPVLRNTHIFNLHLTCYTPKKIKATKGQYSIWMISPFIASESIHHLSLACETVPPYSNQTTVEIHTFKVQQIINSRHLLLAHPQFLTRINITRGWHFRIYCEILILLYIPIYCILLLGEFAFEPNRGHKIPTFKMKQIIWLVVSTLWKILVRLDHHPNYWGK